MQTPDPEIIALFGGAEVKVIYSTGEKEIVLVQQIGIGDWPKALAVVFDEIALTAVFCGRERAWLADEKKKVHPKCYEQLRLAGQEVNKEGFFVYAAREIKKHQDQEFENTARVAALPPEQRAVVLQRGREVLSPSPSTTLPASSASPAPRS